MSDERVRFDVRTPAQRVQALIDDLDALIASEQVTERFCQACGKAPLSEVEAAYATHLANEEYRAEQVLVARLKTLRAGGFLDALADNLARQDRRFPG